MKKKYFGCICALILSLAVFASCSGTPSGTGNNGGESGNNKGMITAKTLTVEELGEGFNAKYLPDTSSIRALTGKIDVCLDFEGTQSGWQALANEYMRLQGGGVQVNINTNIAGSQYADRLNTELKNSKTDWDIVEGNIGDYVTVKERTIDMYPTIAAPNAYCGTGVNWNSVLKPEAYRTKEADNSGVSQIMNTEIMQTCWFINDVALRAAGEKGYMNADGDVDYPITWNDLISLCDYMQQAGYTNPLGITLTSGSIESSQFSWLLRVYGDYYYRQFYKYIMSGTFGTEWENYDPTAEVVENNAGFGYFHSKVLALLFNEDNDVAYVGFQSDIYRDFISNLAKMKGYLISDVAVTEFSELRDKFETQSGGKSSPQILLDYQGFGINYRKAANDSFKLGWFDYPTMESEYVSDDTITRDIGGNGGFVSIINHIGDSAQNDLNKDFIKFVLSPYGQTIYYKGLAAAGQVPKGLSTVKNELVVIPKEWSAFFDESGETITFSGDVDANIFLTFGVRYSGGYTEVQKIIFDKWRGLLMTGLSSSQTLTVDAFMSYWAEAVEKDIHSMTADYGWPNDVWTNPNYNI